MTHRLRLYFKRRNLKKRRLGKFWCDRHWNVVEDSLLDKYPIDPSIAAVGITMALYLKDSDSARPTREACCKIPEWLMNGIFERARNEKGRYTEWMKTPKLKNGTTN